MPSSTFFNLPAEKRRKLLQCAREEFARVPFADASINQIIQQAGIPRGSFYMYFEGKNELFLHLMSSYGQVLEQRFAALLEENAGDLLASFLALYDLIQAEYHAAGQSTDLADLISILRLNHRMQPQIFFHKEYPTPSLPSIRSWVDETLLDLRGEQDFEDCFYLLVGAVGSAMLQGTLAENPEIIRARLVNMLDILARGMVKKPTAPAE